MQKLFKTTFLPYLIYCFLCLPSITLAADVEKSVDKPSVVTIQNAWLRPMQAGQEVGAAYMTLHSAQDLTLTKVTADVSPAVEIHSMTMNNGVMKMRMLKELAIPANTPVSLSPGGFHFMLFDLKKPLMLGDKVKFTLQFHDKQQQTFNQEVEALVKSPEAEEDVHQHH